MLLKMLLSFIVLNLFFGNIENSIHNNRKITVVGIAEDDKDAAIVKADNGYHYIVDGLDEWDEKYYHKRVKISGKLVLENHKKQSTDSIQVQERVGIWRIIKKAKWNLVE
jgi:hypothetical protein